MTVPVYIESGDRSFKNDMLKKICLELEVDSQKLKEETTYFERELGERKLAKTAAARRLQTRPLLSEG